MHKSQSDNKKFLAPVKQHLISELPPEFVKRYSQRFKVYRKSNTTTAINYFQGLIVCEKGRANMERMEEEIDKSEYRAYQHFISNSKWDYKDLMSDISRDTSALLAINKSNKGNPTGYIVDESAHLKKGKESVGAAKQYAGVVGKVENCQVGVYASLVNDTRATIINAKLFLPKVWTDDKKRCEKAGVPEEAMTHKTKPELALAMIDEDVANGVQFDWIGGDGLYGHNYELTDGLDQRNLFFVMDVHKDELIFLQRPILKVPDRKSKCGRKPEKQQPNTSSLRLDKYITLLKITDWETIKIRKTAKGWLKLNIHTACVWVWNKEQNTVKKRTLIISKTIGNKPDVKYSFSNGEVDEYSIKEYAYFQAQRYWVERTFDDAKNELGMSDYQIRKWLSWHHHISLVMMASLYLTKEKLVSEQELPLMSMRDARILMIACLFGTTEQQETRLQQMNARHRKRKMDIDRCFKNQEIEEALLKS